MKITRNGVEYELTAEELYQAYREQQHNYKLDDAKYQLDDYSRYKFGANNADAFAETFGFSLEEVCDKTSAHYLLEKFVEAFNKCHDCGQAENDVWQECIREVLIANAVNFDICYQADYHIQYNAGPSGARFIARKQHSYKSLEELEESASSDIEATLLQRKVYNSYVVVRTVIRKIKTVGGDSGLMDTELVKCKYERVAEMKDGKLVFNMGTKEEGV